MNWTALMSWYIEAPGDAAPVAPADAAPAADEEIETPIAPAAAAVTVPATTLATTAATTAVAAVACFCSSGGRGASAAGVSEGVEQPVIVTLGGAATGILAAIRRSEIVDGERRLEAEAHPDLESGSRAVTSDALEAFRAVRRLPGVALTTASMLTVSALPPTSSDNTSAKRARATGVNSSGDNETNTTTRTAALLAGGGIVHATAPASNGSM
jgi:hypothetical protein